MVGRMQFPMFLDRMPLVLLRSLLIVWEGKRMAHTAFLSKVYGAMCGRFKEL